MPLPSFAVSWIAIASALLAVSCRQRTVEQHCTLRQDLWEAAYSQERGEFVVKMRTVFIKTCVQRFHAPGTEEEFRCHDGCLSDISRGLPPGSEAAKAGYKQLLKCQAKCPGQYCIGQPAW